MRDIPAAAAALPTTFSDFKCYRKNTIKKSVLLSTPHLPAAPLKSDLNLIISTLHSLSWFCLLSRSKFQNFLDEKKGYIDDTTISPSSTFPPNISSNGPASTNAPNPAFWHWLRQDKLILHAIHASVSESVVPLIAASSTAHDAWSKLESRSVSDYPHTIKVIVDELVMIDSPISTDDITFYALNGLGSEFHDIIALI
ncbi:hypothetical protein POTOM_009815 [Populus tomentosa]|uniref:Retrotransposon Copia-like N-terminal domain-containing protein n=1 Tax=Populus tomentosa TaxID=118781 RepID=A0A8X8DAA1_POPTO|nr:hypothetical protein POTOM_009815 [Populus tomentosa]